MSKLIERIIVDHDVGLYVVGDIHGCYDEFISALKAAGFNFSTDLCVSVGDIVDRGEQSEKCLSLLNEHWFRMVKGNHEDFCAKGYVDYMTEFYHKMENNGGLWFYQLHEDTKAYVANRFEKLPLVIEVAYKGKLYGFVHADVAVQDWELFKEMILNDDYVEGHSVRQRCIWSRDTIRKGEPVFVAQVDEVYLGHTVVKRPVKLGNLNFIDTGCVFRKFDPELHLTVKKLGG